ncbi:hypothetical protein ACWKWU_19525 [Chitinophaga lutea]
MEKINALIDKLQELKNTQASLQTISYYAQLLQAEVIHQRSVQKQQEVRGNGHVAVIMPVLTHTPERPVQAAPPPPPPPVQAPPPAPVEVPAAAIPVAKPAAATAASANPNGYAPDRVPVRPQPVTATLFDPPPPAPPANNDIRKELNDIVSRQGSASLNDTLRGNARMEVGEKLGNMGVRDLGNAIGINDKFQFIQELFRGDKSMYERSVRTINESAGLQDAEYWIERELKIKLGWNENDALVRQFYSLVRKRFS